MGIILGVLAVAAVFAIAAIVVGREARRLATKEPGRVFEFEDAVSWVCDHVGPEVAAVLSPDGFGFGDVKLLGLLGLVLGWFGWGVLMTGVFLGLLTGALVSLLLLATRRAGWRTAIPFGPPLLAGAVLTLALGAVSLT